MTGGRCYELSAKAILGWEFNDRITHMERLEAKLVHGVVTNHGKLFKGKRYGHAWIELGNVVIDVATGEVVKMDKNEYYIIGGVNEEECLYYNQKEVYGNVNKYGHWGSWEDGVNPESVWLTEMGIEK